MKLVEISCGGNIFDDYKMSIIVEAKGKEKN